MKKTNKKQENFNIYIVAFSKTRKIKKTPKDIIILNLCTKILIMWVAVPLRLWVMGETDRNW